MFLIHWNDWMLNMLNLLGRYERQNKQKKQTKMQIILAQVLYEFFHRKQSKFPKISSCTFDILFMNFYLRSIIGMVFFKSNLYGLLSRSVTFDFHFTLGIKPSDIMSLPCLTAHASTWLISNHISTYHTMPK